jgi:hypothetical protein
MAQNQIVLKWALGGCGANPQIMDLTAKRTKISHHCYSKKKKIEAQNLHLFLTLKKIYNLQKRRRALQSLTLLLIYELCQRN